MISINSDSKLKYLFILIALFVLIVVPISFSEINSVSITADIQDKTTYLDYILKITENSEAFPTEGEIIYARDTYGEFNYDNQNINLIVPIGEEDSSETERIILIKIKTNDLISNKDEYYEFLYINPIETQTKLTVNLPTSNLITSIPEVKLEKFGESYLVTWNEYSDTYLLRYENKSNNLLWYLIIIIILVILIASISVIFYFYKNKIKTKKEVEKMLNSINVLNEKEKNVVEIIIKNPGISQYKIMEDYNISKSNLSKIIKKLSLSDIIEKRNIGKINKLFPGKKLKE